MNNSKPILLFVLFSLVFVGAIFLGDAVAQENYRLMLNLLIALIAIAYLVKFYQYGFLIFLAITISGTVVQIPIGVLNSGLVGMGFFTISAGYTLLRKNQHVHGAPLWRPGLLLPLIIMIIFGCLYLFQLAMPYSPHEFSPKQTLRALAVAVAPAIVLACWAVNKNSSLFHFGSMRSVLLIMSGIIVFHLGYRIYLISQGYLVAELEMGESQVPVSYHLFGPVSMSPFALRELGPLAVFTSAYIVFKPVQPGQAAENYGTVKLGRGSRQLAWLLLLLGLVAALLSSGRAAVLLSLVGIVSALFYYKRIVPLSVLGAGGLLTIVVLNIFASQLNEKLPFAVNRSISMLILTNYGSSNKAAQSIESSTNWRRELAGLAYEEWVSDSGIFMRGRGVYKYTASDAAANKSGDGYTEVMESSLKTAAAHIRWLELALTFGVIGIVFWYILHVNLFIKVIRIIKNHGQSISPMFISWGALLCLSLPQSLISTTSMSPLIITGLLATSYPMFKRSDHREKEIH